MKTETLLGTAAMAAAFATAALAELGQLQPQDARVAANLETFGILDFEALSGQQWDRLHENHAVHQTGLLLRRPSGRILRRH